MLGKSKTLLVDLINALEVRGKNDRENKELRLVVMYLDKPKMLLVTAIDLL